ncbi:ABC transporter ATP-binding protein [Pseudomonas sp. 10B1]|uniref:ABC transporter ATP-binding protein n=1 Tax=unclassified Pseudomonas TaxID=196821 RepID=UPI002AB43FA0|nr:MULTISPECIES: ABC transporter ATP-binding protein [unclassified Pseudomonas]MDY7560859.1 ABC transporter ATP-binding protein [Pseudomonas sp. AB6]MEA9996190.1 ABC transporter ATP-binding protein [Pseudomonas sp. AA4]MEB0088924.1 ABC transporter ATP-binding protein [Pseudomonas sp. RTI1]MEB0128034.1 ABC transporter ATP-binding protein [Pseudomonas sp. CCC1.2]MEB0154926.1 ABC transporter ATP-binding protein [Pseudomonas sp. CCC4.3]
MSRDREVNRPLPGRPLAFLLRYIRQRPWQFGGLFALVIGAAVCAVAVQYGMKLLVDIMTLGNRSTDLIWKPFALFLTLIVIENLLWRLGGWLGSRTVIASCADLRVDLFNHLTGHPMHYFSAHFAGALGNRISATGAAAGGIYGGLAWKIVPPCVDFIGAVAVLSLVNVGMAVALVGCVLVVATLITLFGIGGRSRHMSFAAQSARVGGEIVDLVSNVWTIKAFSARAREGVRLSQAIGVEAKAQRRSWIYLESARMLHDVCLSLMAGGMLAWALLDWQAGSVTAGDVVMVSALTFRILHGSRDLALALVDTAQQMGAIADTLRIIIQPYALLDANVELFTSKGNIELVDVSYQYPDGRRVLEHLSLFVPAGQRVGIVGSSGAGKSTLIGLIQRLDDVSGGVILIDQLDIRSVSQDSLHRQISVVPQEAALFNRSVYENIRYGRPDAGHEEVLAAARHAYCDEFIRQLPQGYETLVGERGVMLSGGQRQRLGLARAFLKAAPVLILDEATSALDSHCEAFIKAALSDLMKNRTVLAVAHRLSTVANFDRVIVLQEGRVVEDGPPADLLRQGGVYEALWAAQALPQKAP